MAKDPSPELEGRGDTLPSLEATIEDLSKGTSNIAPARAVFRSVDALLAAIKVRFPPHPVKSGADSRLLGLCGR